MYASPERHLKLIFRVAMNQCLKGEKKFRRTFDILGYSVDQLKDHLERQFTEGMTWENYGKTWEIDHILPVAVFNIQGIDSPDLYRAWALKNLRPLNKYENRKKRDTLVSPFQPMLAEINSGTLAPNQISGSSATE